MVSAVKTYSYDYPVSAEQKGHMLESLIKELFKLKGNTDDQEKTELKNQEKQVQLPTQESYEGEYSADNKRSGRGKLVTKTGHIYEGDFKDGFPHGFGKLQINNGNVYKGEVMRGKCHGQGKLTFKNGRTLEGQFENDQAHGLIVDKMPMGDTFVGSFQNGERHGWGKLTLPCKDFYEGFFVNGKPEGQGSFTVPNGTHYEGEVEMNKNLLGIKGKCLRKNGQLSYGSYVRFLTSS